MPEANIADSRYQDLMDDPMRCIETIYRHFDMALSTEAVDRMRAYLEAKPKGKFGKHDYTVDAQRDKDRAYFARYQQLYNVPNEM